MESQKAHIPWPVFLERYDRAFRLCAEFWPACGLPLWRRHRRSQRDTRSIFHDFRLLLAQGAGDGASNLL